MQDYLRQWSLLIRSKRGRKLLYAEINKWIYLKAYVRRTGKVEKEKALREAASWFLYNQHQMEDDGFGTFYLFKGWTSSYPETTGYIIPTLIEFSRISGDSRFSDSARKGLDWLLSIQKKEGGWQSGYVHQDRPAIVFNTGQVIRGMISGYKAFGDERYLISAVRAGDWLASIQHPDGYFDRHVYMDAVRVYETYAVAPLCELSKLTDRPDLAEVALKNARWVAGKKQHSNGWFPDADNTLHKNSRPILHTIAYTIDGLLDVALFHKDEDILISAERPARILLERFLDTGTLPGRFDSKWSGSESLITTGCAQMAIIWNKLYGLTGAEEWKKGQKGMNDLLTAIHQRPVHETRDTRGAIFGSFPFWGRYEPFGCPNWATKYFMDTLMLERED